jgi:hypothetical protein
LRLFWATRQAEERRARRARLHDTMAAFAGGKAARDLSRDLQD